MNLLDKKWLGSALFLALTIFSCDDENQIGQELDNSIDKLTIQYEEFDLTSANIFIDSVRTDDDPYLLTGNHVDLVYGNITAEGYTNYNVLSSARPDSSSTLDSTVLSLTFNKFFGDFNDEVSFVVYETDEVLYNGVVYTADQKASITTTEIGRVQGSYNSADSIINVTLDYNFGLEIFQKLVNMETFAPFEVGENNSLAIVTEGGNGLYGFNLEDALSGITLHYRNTSDTLDYFLDFAADASYNYISSDRSSSKLSFLNDEGPQMFDIDEDTIFMNPATGILPWLNISPVYDFFDGVENVNVISSTLELPVSPVDTSELNSYSTSVRYMFAEENGKFNGSGLLLNPFRNTILSDQSYLGSGLETATTQISEEPLFGFQSDITLFTQLFIAHEIVEETEAPYPYSLVVIPSSSSAIDQTSFFKEGIKLKVYYTVPN